MTARAHSGSPAAGPGGPTRVRPAYDYVLVVGPGRSGSTYLYRLLNGRAGFVAPSIKEAYYYRSPRRLARTLARLGRGAILLDVANRAWRDRALRRLAGSGRPAHRTLVVVLLRRHPERAVSLIAFRRSRVVPWRLAGARRLERAVLADMLTPVALGRIFALDADVLTIGFEALTGDTQGVLDRLARLCATPAVAASDTGPVNASVAARSVFAVAAAKVVAVALRHIGAHRTLQWLKDRPGLMRAFFRPLGDAERTRLGPDETAQLERQYATCVRCVEAASERLDDGVWLRRREAHPAPAPSGSPP